MSMSEYGHEHEYGHDLCAFLDHAVPHLPDPPDRIAQVRRRRAISRRRRGATTSLSLVALAATAAAVAGHGLDLRPSHTAPAAPIASAKASGATQPDTEVLPGVRLQLPRGWSAVRARPPGEVSFGFFSNLPMVAPGCPAAGSASSMQCVPLKWLGPGGVLVILKPSIGSIGQPSFSKWDVPKDLDSFCRALGGRQEMDSVQSVAGPHGTVTFSATACLADPAAQALAQVRVLLTSAHGDTSATPTVPATIDAR